jgi:hypothetical protein
MKAWLLEVNDNPSMDIFHEASDYMGGGGYKELSKVDLYVKQQALGDAIRIAKMS